MDILFWYHVYYAFYHDKEQPNFYFGVDKEYADLTILPKIKLKSTVNNQIFIPDDYPTIPFWKRENLNKYKYLLEKLNKKLIPIKLGLYDINEHTDIIGLNLKGMSGLDQQNINLEIRRCGLVPREIEISLDINDLNNSVKHQPKKLTVTIVKNNGYDKNNISSVIESIKNCKYIISSFNEVILLCYMILGEEFCILIDKKNSWVKDVYTFFDNTIILNPDYEPNSVSNTLNYLYTKDFT